MANSVSEFTRLMRLANQFHPEMPDGVAALVAQQQLRTENIFGRLEVAGGLAPGTLSQRQVQDLLQQDPSLADLYSKLDAAKTDYFLYHGIRSNDALSQEQKTELDGIAAGIVRAHYGTADSKKPMCHTCRKMAAFHCSRCKTVYYCSESCQKLDWKQHKVECLSIPKKH